MDDDVKELIVGIALGAMVQLVSWYFFHRFQKKK